MANFKTHSWTGVATGISTELIHILYQVFIEKKKLNFSEITGRLFWAGSGGFVGATVPDIIDPATNVNQS